MPETGLRAVVAMALAATEVKKNENSSVSSERERPRRHGRRQSVPKKTATASGGDDHADELRQHRDVAVGALAGALAVAERARRDRRTSRRRRAAT